MRACITQIKLNSEPQPSATTHHTHTHPHTPCRRGNALTWPGGVTSKAERLLCRGTHQDLPATPLRLITERDGASLAWSITWCHRSSRWPQMPAAVRAKWKIVQLTWHLTSHSSRTGGERRRKEKGRGERAQFVERPFLKEGKSKMRWHPPTFRAYLQKPECTHSSNDHHINAKASLPFSSCFLDFKIACSYGLDSDNLLHKCSRKTYKKTSPWSLSVPWELPSPANWICIWPSSSGTGHAQWPSQKRV